jgi:uncharacterized protein YicC (UPF0701 family)
MVMRFPRLAVRALLAMLALAGCGDDKAKIGEIQKKADERIAQIEQTARDKVAELQKKMESAQADLADAAAQVKAEANDAINKAQASADEATKAASDALDRARKAYKEEGRIQLATLKQEATDVNAKVGKASATVKTAVQKSMQKVTDEEKAVQKDIDAFDTATLNTFKTAKAQLDKDVASLKATIKAAKARLPASS